MTFGVHETFQVLSATSTVHVNRFCAGAVATPTTVTAADLATFAGAAAARRLCPTCASNLASLGVDLAYCDIETLKSIDRVERLTPAERTANPVQLVRVLHEALLDQQRPENPAVRSYYTNFLASVPDTLTQVRASTGYRKAVLRACVNGLRHLLPAPRVERLDEAHAPARTHVATPATQQVLDELRAQFTPLLSTHAPQAFIDVDQPLTSAESALAQDLSATAWVGLRLFEGRDIYGFVLDMHPTDPQLVRVPALVLATNQLTSYPYWYALDPQATRWEVYAAYHLVRHERISSCRSLDEHVQTVRIASAP